MENWCVFFSLPPRKGLAPNPYDETALSNAGWSAEQFEQARDNVNQMRQAIRNNPYGIDGVVEDLKGEFLNNGVTDNTVLQSILAAYRDDLEAAQQEDSRVSKSGKIEKYLQDSHKDQEQRPAKIMPIPAADRDTRFKFLDGKNSFSVRGSRLGPVLMGYRRVGIQHATLQEVQRALQHLS